MPMAALSVSGHQVEKPIADPPGLPADYIYTRCYCEENAYMLCKEFMGQKEVCERWEVWVIFISNETKTVALWEQKVAHERGAPIVWDYHAILVLKSKRTARDTAPISLLGDEDNDVGDQERPRSWVYDFDTSIAPVPCKWREYITKTFPYHLPLQYRSLFRLISGDVFLNYFASDRSHMLRRDAEQEEPEYGSKPPVYDPIRGKLSRTTNNLMQSFVCMDPYAEDTYGEVMSFEEMVLKL